MTTPSQTVEAALEGREPGHQTLLTLLPEEGFGPSNESLLRTIPKKEFPASAKVGGQLQGVNDAGAAQVYNVLKPRLSIRRTFGAAR